MTTSLKASALGGVAAVIANLVVFFWGNVPQTVLTPFGRPINAVAVIAVTFSPVFLAGAVFYALSDRFWAYRALVILLTLASLVTPFGIEGAPGTMVVTLLVMHLVAGGAAAFLVPRIAETLAEED
ncbi:MAG: DUF6069 family protein [Actinomycetota bacterium]